MKTFYGFVGIVALASVVTWGLAFLGAQAIRQIDGYVLKPSVSAKTFYFQETTCEKAFLEKHDSLDRDAIRFCKLNPESTIW